MKILHLNLPPVSLEMARTKLAALDAEVVAATCTSEEEVVAAARDADAVIGAALGRLFTPAVLGQLERCQIVSLWSGSTDHLDVDAFTEAGICVCFGADACTEEVADHGMALMLAAGRRLFVLDGLVRSEPTWTEHDHIVDAALPMPRMSQVTVGSIGFGRAGVALATRCRGFGMRFVAHDPYVPLSAGDPHGVELTTKEQVLRQSDFVHIYVPMSADTERIIGEEDLRQMKPTAWLVNSSSRASVIDEQALHAALVEGRLAGAALDNLGRDPDEPERPSALLDLPNVIVTPHVSHVSNESYSAMQDRVCSDVVDFFGGVWPALVANPAVKEKVELPG